jgi:hypothetical protein
VALDGGSIPPTSTFHSLYLQNIWTRRLQAFEELHCAGCGKAFQKASAEVTRQRKKNPDRLFFCSRRCYSLARGKANLGTSCA